MQGCAVTWACGVYLGPGIMPDQGRCPSRQSGHGALLVTGPPDNKAAGQRVLVRAVHRRPTWPMPSNWRPGWAYTWPLADGVASTDRITAAQRVLYVRIVYLGELEASTRRHRPELGFCPDLGPRPRLSCGTRARRSAARFSAEARVWARQAPVVLRGPDRAPEPSVAWGVSDQPGQAVIEDLDGSVLIPLRWPA